MRAVEAHSGVVRSFYVRQISHAVGKPIAMFFGRHSAAQFAAEILAASFAFDRISARGSAHFFITIPARVASKFNDKRFAQSPTFVAAAKVCVP
jgi:predicted metal-dependent phosphoesterase TrpH